MLIPGICKHHLVEKKGLCKSREGFQDEEITLDYLGGP